MTDNHDNLEQHDQDNGEVSHDQTRRRLMRIGLTAAPIALTLHGGLPLAHADSLGLCVLQLEEQAAAGDPDLQIPVNGNPNSGNTVPFDSSNSDHWEYIQVNNLEGASCLTSIEFYNHMNNPDFKL